MPDGDTFQLKRRTFIAGAAAAALVGAACSGDDDDDDQATGEGDDEGDDTSGGLPTAATIFGWINEVYDQGIRRPGYDADVWAEDYIAKKFEEIGLENIRKEPVPLTRWEPTEWKLEVTPQGGETVSVDCFPLPHLANADHLSLELAAFDPNNPKAVEGKASLYEVKLLSVPPDIFVSAGSAPEDTTNRIIDPDGTFKERNHLLPFGSELSDVVEPSMEAGAKAFIGTLTDYPEDSYKYYVPYDGKDRPIPGVWTRGSDGAWLREQLTKGPVQINLTVETEATEFESHNIVGELPGVDDEVVMVGSHHDGPWASAVEDGSGIALVLAQAAHWAAQPKEERPHKMVFLLQGGHMFGGAGLHKYIEDHKAELDKVVLELHLEHAALDFEVNDDGSLKETGQCVPRWWFTSRIPPLEDAVIEALNAEKLSRSMLLAPDAIGTQPPTDGAFYHNEGVPIVHFLEAPFYLFDEMDKPDKIDQENLEPLSRAAIRIIESTAGVSAADMRAAKV